MLQHGDIFFFTFSIYKAQNKRKLHFNNQNIVFPFLEIHMKIMWQALLPGIKHPLGDP